MKERSRDARETIRDKELSDMKIDLGQESHICQWQDKTNKQKWRCPILSMKTTEFSKKTKKKSRIQSPTRVQHTAAGTPSAPLDFSIRSGDLITQDPEASEQQQLSELSQQQQLLQQQQLSQRQQPIQQQNTMTEVGVGTKGAWSPSRDKKHDENHRRGTSAADDSDRNTDIAVITTTTQHTVHTSDQHAHLFEPSEEDRANQ